MVKKYRFWQTALDLSLLAVALFIWLGVMRDFRLDDSFITYRYARNLREGLGLVYNPGENILSTTAPFYAGALAAFSYLIPDFPLLGALVTVISIAVGGWMIYRLLPTQVSPPIRAWASLVYVLTSPLWLALGMETALWIALVLVAIYYVTVRRWWLSGIAGGVAIMTRPDSMLPVALLAIWFVFMAVQDIGTRRDWSRPLAQFMIALVVPLAVFIAWSVTAYGSPFPVTLGAKGAQAVLGITGMGPFVDTWQGLGLIISSLMTQSPLYVVVMILAILGLSRRLSFAVVLVLLWAVFHLLAYILLRVAPYRWYYAPFVPAVILLSAWGLDGLRSQLRVSAPLMIRRGMILAIALVPLIAQAQSFQAIATRIAEGGTVDVMLPIVDWRVYRQTGEWLDHNTPPNASVGVAEVGQIGFYARRPMTDYLGLLQPDVSAMLRRSDLYSWLVKYAPDYLVFQRFRGAALVLYNFVIQDDLWFRSLYQPAAEFDDPRYFAGPVTVFSRSVTMGALQEQTMQFDYAGLRLLGLGMDSTALTVDGGPVRIRLDWEVTGPLPVSLHIAVKGVNLAGTNPGHDIDYRTDQWSGRFSTWHGFVAPPGIASGHYDLLVAVGPTGGPYDERVVGVMSVP